MSAAALGFAARSSSCGRASHAAPLTISGRWALDTRSINPFPMRRTTPTELSSGAGSVLRHLGIYTRASFFANTATTLFGNISRLSIFPAMSEVQHDETRLRSALLKSFSVLALLTLPISAFCVIFAPEIVDLLLGGKWHAAVVPFAILSGTLYFTLAWRDCATLFQALGHPYWMTAAHICRAAALIAGIWWIAPARPYSDLCGDRRGHGTHARDHAHDRQIRDPSSTPKHRCGTLLSPLGHCSGKWSLSDVEGAPASVAWYSRLVSRTRLAPLISLRLRLLQPRARIRLSRGSGVQQAAYWKQMKLILHIGTHKTGTTALQQFLHANRASLGMLGFHYATPSHCLQEANVIENALNGGRDDVVYAFFAKQLDLAERRGCCTQSLPRPRISTL